MLAIRMQRTGRKGHTMFRMVVQESRLHPSSGRVVARLGHYDPHTKALSLDKEKAATYLENGARPSDRITLIFKKEGVKLPSWVEVPQQKTGSIRNPDKLRKNAPAAEAAATTEDKQETDAVGEASPEAESSSEKQSSEDKAQEASAEESTVEPEPKK